MYVFSARCISIIFSGAIDNYIPRLAYIPILFLYLVYFSTYFTKWVGRGGWMQCSRRRIHEPLVCLDFFRAFLFRFFVSFKWSGAWLTTLPPGPGGSASAGSLKYRIRTRYNWNENGMNEESTRNEFNQDGDDVLVMVNFPGSGGGARPCRIAY